MPSTPSRMRIFLLLVSTAVIAPRLASAQSVVVFVDGKRMEVQSYEVKEGLVVLKTKEGKLMSVPRSYVNLVATEEANRGGQGTSAPARPPARTPAPPPKPDPQALSSETVEPEPPVRAPEPPPPTPAPAPTPATPPPPSPNLAASPPPSGRTRSFK